MTTDRKIDAQRLLERTDVADAGVLADGFIYVTDSIGTESGPLASYAEAVSWLCGADDHLVGMAICGCKLCGPYIGSR